MPCDADDACPARPAPSLTEAELIALRAEAHHLLDQLPAPVLKPLTVLLGYLVHPPEQDA